MSSIVGHAGAGVAVYLCSGGLKDRRAWLALPMLVTLAIAPDFDYLAYWIFGIHAEPRFTHSLAFALFASGVAWLLTRAARQTDPRFAGFLACAVAASSHCLLDLLVGVHPVPVFWPLPVAELSAPIGLLPSAGRINMGNFYFWRNLLIECGVLLPVYALCIALARGMAARRIGLGMLLACPVWGFFLHWSMRVHS